MSSYFNPNNPPDRPPQRVRRTGNDQVFAGGDSNFDELTGQYKTTPSRQAGAFGPSSNNQQSLDQEWNAYQAGGPLTVRNISMDEEDYADIQDTGDKGAYNRAIIQRTIQKGLVRPEDFDKAYDRLQKTDRLLYRPGQGPINFDETVDNYDKENPIHRQQLNSASDEGHRLDDVRGQQQALASWTGANINTPNPTAPAMPGGMGSAFGNFNLPNLPQPGRVSGMPSINPPPSQIGAVPMPGQGPAPIGSFQPPVSGVKPFDPYTNPNLPLEPAVGSPNLPKAAERINPLNPGVGPVPDTALKSVDPNFKNDPRRNSLYDTLLQQASRSEVPLESDPAIAGQVAAFRGEQTRAARNLISDNAEASGPLSNNAGFNRMAAERLGQSVGSFQADLIGRELQSRRDMISQRLNSMQGMLSEDQQAELQKELAIMDKAIQQQQLGVTERGQNINRELTLGEQLLEGRGQDINQRGQDLNFNLGLGSQTLEGRGQDITQRGQNLDAKIAQSKLGLEGRGQDLTARGQDLGKESDLLRALLETRGQDVTQRGQDLGRESTLLSAMLEGRGQDVTQRGQSLTNNIAMLQAALEGRGQDVTQRGQDISQQSDLLQALLTGRGQDMNYNIGSRNIDSDLYRAMLNNQQYYAGLGSENDRFSAQLGLNAADRAAYYDLVRRGLI